MDVKKGLFFINIKINFLLAFTNHTQFSDSLLFKIFKMMFIKIGIVFQKNRQLYHIEIRS